MKSQSVFFLFLTIFLGHTHATWGQDQEIDALFSPQNGPAAFERAFDLIKTARENVGITVYSWNDLKFDQAMEAALKQNPQLRLRVVLNPSLANNSRLTKRIRKLEELGAEFKRATQNMHEKFVLADNERMCNTSANMTAAAPIQYSEAFTYIQPTSSPELKDLVKDFGREFAVLWNSSSDIKSGFDGEQRAQPLEIVDAPARAGRNAVLYSSSMNFLLVKNPENSVAYKNGKDISLSRKRENGELTWVVRDKLLEGISQARKSIWLGINHFFLKDVADALLKAVQERGIEVRLAVDNQEYSPRYSPKSGEITPYFVEEWKKLYPDKEPPVRVKYYSHCPTPRFWHLNHHKFVLIDYEPQGPGENTILLTGSYNLSENAEHDQFDNLVNFKGKDYQSLYTAYAQEFEYLWAQNRENGKPKKEVWDLFLTPTDEGAYPLHINNAMGLSWAEVAQLQKEVGAQAKGFFSKLTQRYCFCTAYLPPKDGVPGKFLGCANGE
jgi:phosphatidylserine/phosphatidylglycerophosphate/cardiolipin synthase-like enzyme